MRRLHGKLSLRGDSGGVVNGDDDHQRAACGVHRREERPGRHPQGRHRHADALLLQRAVHLRRLQDVRGGGRAGEDRLLLLHGAEGRARNPHQHCPPAALPQDDPRAPAGGPRVRLHGLLQERFLPPPDAGPPLRREARSLRGHAGAPASGRVLLRDHPQPQQVHPVRRLRSRVQRNSGHGDPGLRQPRLRGAGPPRLQRAHAPHPVHQLRPVRGGVSHQRHPRQAAHRRRVEGYLRPQKARRRSDRTRRPRGAWGALWPRARSQQHRQGRGRPANPRLRPRDGHDPRRGLHRHGGGGGADAAA